MTHSFVVHVAQQRSDEVNDLEGLAAQYHRRGFPQTAFRSTNGASGSGRSQILGCSSHTNTAVFIDEDHRWDAAVSTDLDYLG